MDSVHPQVLELLACPAPECRGPLKPLGPPARSDDRLACTACGLEYPVTSRWPVLIPEDAQRPDHTAQSGDRDKQADPPGAARPES